MARTGSSRSLVIVDYGTGNLGSVTKVLRSLGIDATVSARPRDVATADKIILPGIGHFARTMEHLNESGMLDVLNEFVLADRKPVLGICLGMELMAERSEEGDAVGLGWLKGKVEKFRIEDKRRFKVPHMGWNQIRIQKPTALLAGLPTWSEFYFAHAYHLLLNDACDIVGDTEYETPFPSVIEKGNIFGVQFHPEKSQDAGRRLLKNFVEI